MTLFDDNRTVAPAPRRARSRGRLIGLWSLVVALVVLLVISFLPTSYVIQQAGPVFNTLGGTSAADGAAVPLITIRGAKTYPTSGTLDMLTVQVVGNPERTPSWFELAGAWFDRSRAVIPLKAAFPDNQTSEESDKQSAAMMVDSQKEATAAALGHLGYDVHPRLQVYSLTSDSAAQGSLRKGDVLVSADGDPVTDADRLRTIVNQADGTPIALQVERDGTAQTVSVAPKKTVVDGADTWLLGISLITDYTFPIDVKIQLNDVGGPSAGMMFALGIIDKLTPGELNGGRRVAGTGTISADGTVGPIGGIRQKLWGAVRAGAKYFLAPASNCDEVVGHVPPGLRVFSVKTLDDSLTALDDLRSGDGLDALPTCTAHTAGS